jgi:proteasome assembly chaperone (PAC2) family protein
LNRVTNPRVAQLLPPLRDTLVLAAFQGWNDAGEAASDALEHLGKLWGAQPIVGLDPEDYYDFQVNRPSVRMVDDTDPTERHIDWPTTRLSVARPADIGRDVLLVHGLEPNIRWRAFCNELIDVFVAADASLVVTLGALLADSPHTRPVPVSGVAYDKDTATRLGLESSRYEGPTGIVGVLQDACTQASLPALSLWAAVPHYVAQPPSPKATVALLRKIEDLLDFAVDLGDLEDRARGWEHTVDELAAEDGDIAEYVHSLEEREVTELPEATGEAIAQEFERFLRRRGGS